MGAVKSPGGAALNGIANYRHRLLAVNSRGETAFLGNAGGIERLLVIAPGDLQARSVATLGAPLAGGLLTAVEQVAIDEDGRVSFIGRLTGRQMLFFLGSHQGRRRGANRPGHAHQARAHRLLLHLHEWSRPLRGPQL